MAPLASKRQTLSDHLDRLDAMDEVELAKFIQEVEEDAGLRVGDLGSDSVVKGYTVEKDIVRHINNSTASTHGQEHDKRKAEDGFNDEDFIGNKSSEGSRHRVGSATKRLRDANFVYHSQPELVAPEPTNHPGILFGDFGSSASLTRDQDVFKRGIPPPMLASDTAGYAVAVSPGEFASRGIPEALKGFVRVVDPKEYLKEEQERLRPARQ